MTDAPELQYRCAWCNRRLCDYTSNIEYGFALVAIQCPKCGTGNSLRLQAPEVPRDPAPRAPSSAHTQQEALP